MSPIWICRNNGKILDLSKENLVTREELIQEAFEASRNPAEDEVVRNFLNNPNCPQDVRLN